MSKIRNNETMNAPGHALLAIALDDIIPAHEAIIAARHRSRKHPSEVAPKWRATLGAVIRYCIERDRDWMGRKKAHPTQPIDVFATDANALEYILRTVMPERAECLWAGECESDNYRRWAHQLKAMVDAAISKDREYYGGTKRTNQ